MKNCPNPKCGKEVKAHWRLCPECGADLTEQKQVKIEKGLGAEPTPQPQKITQEAIAMRGATVTQIGSDKTSSPQRVTQEAIGLRDSNIVQEAKGESERVPQKVSQETVAARKAQVGQITGNGKITQVGEGGTLIGDKKYEFNIYIKDPYLNDAIKSAEIGEKDETKENLIKAMQHGDSLSGKDKQKYLGLIGEVVSEIEKTGLLEDPEIFIELGNKAFKKELYTPAMDYYDKALKIDTKNFDVHKNKGKILFSRGNYDMALKSFTSALKLNEFDAELHKLKGDCLESLNKYSEAVDAYEMARSHNFNYVEALNNKGITLDRLNKHEEAIEYFNKALEINSSMGTLWLNKGVAHYNLKEYDEALECFERALSMNHEDSYTQNNKGAALIMKKQYNEAIECFKKALMFCPRTDPNRDIIKKNKEGGEELARYS